MPRTIAPPINTTTRTIEIRFRRGPITAASLKPAPLRLEDLFDLAFESSGQREGQGQARVVLAGFDGVHCLTRDAQPLRQVSLRPVQLGAQDSQPILHR